MGTLCSRLDLVIVPFESVLATSDAGRRMYYRQFSEIEWYWVVDELLLIHETAYARRCLMPNVWFDLLILLNLYLN